MYDKADVSANDRLFSWIKKLRRLLAGSIIDHILKAWKKEEILDLIEFTIAYQITEKPQIDPSEMPLVLQRLNGDRPRKELPRFIGSVLGFSCAISGETEDELKDNAKKKIQSLRRVRLSRGLPIPMDAKVAVQLPASSGRRTLIVTVPESTERIS